MRSVRRHYNRWGIYQGYSATPELDNPHWWALWLCVVTAILFYLAAVQNNGTLGFCGGFALMLAVIASARRRIKAHRICEHIGHDPYRPVEGSRFFRCWRCGDDLPADYEVPTREKVREAADRVKQSYYSDRS
jgi:hypothetical protein